MIGRAQRLVLTALAEYKFLTTGHMVALGIRSTRTNLYPVLKPLKESKRSLIGELRFGTDPKKGSLESFYYLKTKGKNYLLQNGYEEDEIKIPKSAPNFGNIYFHRKLAIDCEIKLKLQCKEQGIEVIQFDRDFDKSGSQRGRDSRSATHISFPGGYKTADGSFLIDNGDISRLYAFELSNRRDARKVMEGMKMHIRGMEADGLCENFGVEKAHRVLYVFSDESKKRSVMFRFDPQRFGDDIFMKTYKEAQEDFLHGWSDFFGQTHSLL